MSIRSQKNVSLQTPNLRPALERLQGNILKGHGRDKTVHIFFQFKPESSVSARRSLMKQLSLWTTSAWEQMAQGQAYKSGNDIVATFCNLFLSARGYSGLGFSAEQLAEAFPEKIGPVPFGQQITFKNGMAFHQTDLLDPPIFKWEPGYARDAADPSERGLIDGMVLLANDDANVLRQAEIAIRHALDSCATPIVSEYGQAIFNSDSSQNLEHFGYVDGRSQPTFFADQRDAEEKKDGVDVWDPAEPLGLVLVPDLLAPREEQEHSFGSYFVFRKLEQNVRGFKAKEKEVAAALRLTGNDEALAGAMAVGRFEDGTPVVLQPTDGRRAPVPNNFRFDTDDKMGTKCPFHAHVRKMSPRGDSLTTSTEETERSHRIARRGITYGCRPVEPRDKPDVDQLPTRGVGLLFMCFQSLIDNQFAFMQRAWANNVDFARPFFAAGPKTGLDPVIGQSSLKASQAQTWPTPWGQSTTTTATFDSFVTMLGGEFFFAPSLPFFASL